VYDVLHFSVQLNETINAASLYATDLEVIIPSNIHPPYHPLQVFKEDPFGCCQHNAITNVAAVAREAVAPPKLAPGVQMERARPAETKKTGGIESAFAKTARKPSDDPPTKSASVKTEAKPKRSPEKKSQSASSASGSKKPAGGIANFFAAQAARPKVEKVKVEESKDTKGEEKENIVNNQMNKEEAVPKEKPAKELIKKPTTKKAETKSFGKKDKEETEDGKKRKRIQVRSDSEEEEEEVRSEGEEEEAPPQAKLLQSDSEDEVSLLAGILPLLLVTVCV
jgi:hypothetical protein